MKYREDYKKLHEQGVFKGLTLAKFSEPVVKCFRWIGVKSALDFGAGTGASWESPDLKEYKLEKLVQYDPGIPEKEALPEGLFDAVLVFDVLEHVPEDEVNDVLKEIFSHSSRLVMMSFCPRGSRKKLPSTGEDVHVTQKPREWWEQRISAANLSYGKPTLWFLFENP